MTVSGVVEVRNDQFQFFRHLLHVVVRLIAEEDIDGVGESHEVMLLRVALHLLAERCEAHDIALVVWLREDYLLAADLAFLAHAEELDEEEAVGIHVEDYGVFVCLVCDEDGYRHEDHRRESLAEGYGP